MWNENKLYLTCEPNNTLSRHGWTSIIYALVWDSSTFYGENLFTKDSCVIDLMNYDIKYCNTIHSSLSV